MDSENDKPTLVLRGEELLISGSLKASTIGALEKSAAAISPQSYKSIEGSGITALDSTGAIFINNIGKGKTLAGFSALVQKLLAMSRLPEIPEVTAVKKKPLIDLEALGDWGYRTFGRIYEITILIVEILYWSIVGIFDRRQYRRGSFTEQTFYMGSTALPIVGVILFLVGFILTLQSAAQLRQFGATIYVVDLLAIGLAKEMAPLMVAILVSGRSGSAIASEIATMKFTEELDAIKTMGLNPIRFVVVPKLWAMVISMPLLTIMALLIGLLGGFVVSVTYMGLAANTFYQELLRALFFWDVVTGIIKSLSFAVIITIVGTYRGLTFSGGADGVGRATTSSVVTSLFVIIVADSIWGIIFYFRG
ncbi:MAG: ABC transporter permease [Candidatus Latescibacter sp.]|nr:ABC transporter permease [Candidatus Latescibacter sp.]